MGNAHLFAGEPRDRTYLRARGFDDGTGARAGGIINPEPVQLPLDTVLIRLFGAERERNPSEQPQHPAYGDWWNTPYELHQVLEYIGGGGELLTSGARGGGNALTAFLALLPWWNDARHFAVVRIGENLHAWHGEGDEAKGRRAGDVPLVPPKIFDRSGRCRRVRQLFIPDFRFCAFTVLAVGGSVAGDFLKTIQHYDTGPLRFEK